MKLPSSVASDCFRGHDIPKLMGVAIASDLLSRWCINISFMCIYIYVFLFLFVQCVLLWCVELNQAIYSLAMCGFQGVNETIHTFP